MSFQQQFEELIRQVHDLEKEIFAAKDKDIIPLSFFSSSIDCLNKLQKEIHEIELAQFNLMQEHLKKTGDTISPQTRKSSFVKDEVEIQIPKQMPETEKEPTPESVENALPSENKVFLSDRITKGKLTDLRKSLSLNERFMFQRDIFQNNPDKMNQTLETLNDFDNINDVLNYLNSNYPIQWESEAGSLFRELLEKRFS